MLEQHIDRHVTTYLTDRKKGDGKENIPGRANTKAESLEIAWHILQNCKGFGLKGASGSYCVGIGMEKSEKAGSRGISGESHNSRKLKRAEVMWRPQVTWLIWRKRRRRK